MKRVVVLTWKNRQNNKVEIFSNLKILCEAYREYNYNTLNNYLSKAKVPYENGAACIERVVVQNQPVPQRQMAMVATRVKMREHDEAAMDTAFWLSRPAAERLQAVTRLSSQLKRQKSERMDKTQVVKRKM
jgi:hypothetical protein